MHIDDPKTRNASEPDRKSGADPGNSDRRWMCLTPNQCLVTALAIFVAMVLIGAIPGYAKTLSDATNDKFLHLCAYALLTALIFNGLTGVVLGRALATVLAIAFLGAIDEAIQSFMPYRTASILDWYFDMISVLVTIAILVIRALARRVAANSR